MAELASHAQVVIIGGGAVGTSCLYHLALAGITDVVLIEKNQLTSGSTWHAAGNTPNFTGSLNLMKLQHYGSMLYNRIGEKVGYRYCQVVGGRLCFIGGGWVTPPFLRCSRTIG